MDSNTNAISSAGLQLPSLPPRDPFPPFYARLQALPDGQQRVPWRPLRPGTAGTWDETCTICGWVRMLIRNGSDPAAKCSGQLPLHPTGRGTLCPGAELAASGQVVFNNTVVDRDINARSHRVVAATGNLRRPVWVACAVVQPKPHQSVSPLF